MCSLEAVLAVSERTIEDTAAAEKRKQNKKIKNFEKEYEAFNLTQKYLTGGNSGLQAKDWKKILTVLCQLPDQQKRSPFTKEKKDYCKNRLKNLSKHWSEYLPSTGPEPEEESLLVPVDHTHAESQNNVHDPENEHLPNVETTFEFVCGLEIKSV